MNLSGADDDMVSYRTAAIRAGIKAMIPVASDEEKEELETAVANAESYGISDYTGESYGVLSDAVIEAKRFLNNSDLTKGMISYSVKRINTAIKGLIKDSSDDVKTSELELWITNAKSYIRSDEYTGDDKAELTELTFEAVQLLGKTGVTQDEIQKMTDDLKAAIDKLVKTVDKSGLKDLLDEAERYVETSYTTSSWQIFEEALETAQSVYKNSSATAALVKKCL